MPLISKILIVVSAIAYLSGGIAIFNCWFRFYTDTHEEPVWWQKMFAAVCIVPTWIFLVVIIWAINRKDELEQFLKRIAR